MITLNIWENGKWSGREFGSRHSWRPRDPVHQLQLCLDSISKPSPHCRFQLRLFKELISQPVLVLLIQLLNQPNTSQSSSTTESTTNTGDETIKWESVDFTECRLALPDLTSFHTLEDKGLYCNPDDIQIFGSTLSRRTTSLELCECPDILYALCDAAELEISTWRIEKREFSALDCARLANSLQRGCTLECLILKTCYIEDPIMLVEGLIYVKDLRILGCSSPSARPNYPSLGNMLVGEGGNGMMQRVLQSTFSQTEVLSLVDAQLDDRHFMAIVDMLPTSQLKNLSLPFNNISWHGILAFARLLPKITCLKGTQIGPNSSGESSLKVDHQECCVALTQGMHDNYSIENLSMADLDTQAKHLLSYYADLNHAGRRILVTSKPIPAGLWPLILERAGNKCFRDLIPDRQVSKRVDAIYFLLQNCQALWSFTRASTREPPS